MHARRILGAVAALVTTLPGGCQGGEAAPAQRMVAPCSWSYFGDPRAVAHGSHVITGCVATDGRTVLEDYDPDTGRAPVATGVRPARGRRPQQPEPRLLPRAAVRVLRAAQRLPVPARPPEPGPLPVSTRPWGAGGGFGADADGPARRAAAGSATRTRTRSWPADRLYLFMRGPCWEPYFTSTADGRDWTAPRTIVKRPPERAGRRRQPPRAPVREVRRRARASSVLMTFSDGHPASFRSSLYFLRYRGRPLHRGRRARGRHARRSAAALRRARSRPALLAPRAAAPGRWTSRPAPTARR